MITALLFILQGMDLGYPLPLTYQAADQSQHRSLQLAVLLEFSTMLPSYPLIISGKGAYKPARVLLTRKGAILPLHCSSYSLLVGHPKKNTLLFQATLKVLVSL